MGISLLRFEDSPATCLAEFDLPPHAAIFRDHFPHQPLLPAVGLLALCHWTIERWLGGQAGMTSLRRLRFTAPIPPRTRLGIHLTRRGADRLRLVARSAAGDHASGELAVANMQAAAGEPPPAGAG